MQMKLALFAWLILFDAHIAMDLSPFPIMPMMKEAFFIIFNIPSLWITYTEWDVLDNNH